MSDKFFFLCTGEKLPMTTYPNSEGLLNQKSRIFDEYRHKNKFVQSAGAVEYTDCTSAEG